MALGRQGGDRQEELWIVSSEVPRSAGHVFYEKLNELLHDAGFDVWLEGLCESYYSNTGRRSIPPGVYFRMLLVGYFEGLGSQRGIAWRCSDSLSLRSFLGLSLTDSSPDHSSLTRIRDRLPMDVHHEVFRFVLRVASEHGLIQAKQVAVDATTLEANAAMKSIVRRDTGDDWKAYLKKLMVAAGEISEDDDPTDEDLRRFDKRRKDKKVSNQDWESTSDPDSRITKMKDGRTHLAHKAEHVIDLQTEIILAAPVYPADSGDCTTLPDSLVEAQMALDSVGIETPIAEVVADKGYHSAASLEVIEFLGMRSYIPEPKLKHKRKWKDKDPETKRAAYANRRRTRTAKGKRLQRQRSERVERSFAHVCQTGGARRAWLRGEEKVGKRHLMAAMGHNLGVVMRSLFGVGTARSFQGLAALAWALYPTQIAPWQISSLLITSKRMMTTLSKTLERAMQNFKSLADMRFSTAC